VQMTLMALHHVLLAATTAKTTTHHKNNYTSLIFIVVIFAVVYVVFLRPRANRARAAVAQKRSAEVGDEVTTTSGLIATVVAIDDDALTLEVAPGVHCRYVPAAILRVNVEEEPDVEAPDASNHEVIDDPTIVTPAAEPHDDHDADEGSPGATTETPDGPASS
jgi:preprotein translocase subunit YajC